MAADIRVVSKQTERPDWGDCLRVEPVAVELEPGRFSTKRSIIITNESIIKRFIDARASVIYESLIKPFIDARAPEAVSRVSSVHTCLRWCFGDVECDGGGCVLAARVLQHLGHSVAHGQLSSLVHEGPGVEVFDDLRRGAPNLLQDVAKVHVGTAFDDKRALLLPIDGDVDVHVHRGGSEDVHDRARHRHFRVVAIRNVVGRRGHTEGRNGTATKGKTGRLCAGRGRFGRADGHRQLAHQQQQQQQHTDGRHDGVTGRSL
mmetsp:Transcript_28473/g.82041  ORF Transcript_28473/g.82041 Transcript_28473/m.82041 type:complete len:261 (-) Transcript_28473:74-856(-)